MIARLLVGENLYQPFEPSDLYAVCMIQSVFQMFYYMIIFKCSFIVSILKLRPEILRHSNLHLISMGQCKKDTRELCIICTKPLILSARQHAVYFVTIFTWILYILEELCIDISFVTQLILTLVCLFWVYVVYFMLCTCDSFCFLCYNTYQWFRARLQYLHCLSNGGIQSCTKPSIYHPRIMSPKNINHMCPNFFMAFDLKSIFNLNSHEGFIKLGEFVSATGKSISCKCVMKCYFQNSYVHWFVLFFSLMLWVLAKPSFVLTAFKDL